MTNSDSVNFAGRSPYAGSSLQTPPASPRVSGSGSAQPSGSGAGQDVGPNLDPRTKALVDKALGDVRNNIIHGVDWVEVRHLSPWTESAEKFSQGIGFSKSYLSKYANSKGLTEQGERSLVKNYKNYIPK